MEQLQSQTPEAPQERTVTQSLERFLARERGEEWEPPSPETAAEPAAESAPEAPPVEAEGEAQPEEGQEPPPTAEELAEIELEGKQYKVPAALKDGYLRQADYTRKTQAIAQEAKVVAAAKASAEQAFEVLQTLGPLVADWHQAQRMAEQYQKVDWNALYESDPMLHNKTRLDAQDNWNRFQILTQQLQQAPTALRDMKQKAFIAEVQRNAPKVKELVPDLDKRRDDMMASGKHYGFSDEELNAISDPRYVHALRDLAEYRKLTANREQIKQRVAAAPPVARPGAKGTPPASKDYSAAVKALKKDSSDEAFIAALRAQRKAQGG